MEILILDERSLTNPKRFWGMIYGFREFSLHSLGLVLWNCDSTCRMVGRHDGGDLFTSSCKGEG